jgi:hypothetical protein
LKILEVTMKNKAMFLLVPILLLTVPLAGCPIWWEEYDHDEHWVCDSDPCWNDTCYDDYDCYEGTYCSDGYCTSSSTCSDYGDCPSGYVCDIYRDTCVPVDVCNVDSDCYGYPAYCDEESNVCIPTDYCFEDGDCLEFGESFVCSDRGVCEPDKGPCPDGHCGCTVDGDCSAGWVCEENLCRNPAGLCVFDFECPAGTTCVNSFCRVSCAGGTGCPTGQLCRMDSFCADDADGGGQCVYASECGANQRCVNGYCTATCSVATECSAYEDCIGGICRVSIPAVFECTAEGQCATGYECRDHACRMPCAADINCQAMGEFSRCAADDVCRTPEEIAGQCSRGGDCAGDLCLNGACL